MSLVLRSNQLPITSYFHIIGNYHNQHLKQLKKQFKVNKKKWKKGSCFCPVKYMCKHIIGFALLLKYVKHLAEANKVPIEEKRKFVRPLISKKE